MIRRIQLVLLARPLRPVYTWLRRLYQLGNYIRRRPHEEDFAAFRHFSDRPGWFLDIGASSGTSAMSFRLYNRNTPILAIEPNVVLEPELRFLKRILRPFDYRLWAAGAEDGAAVLYVPRYRGMPITAESSLSRRSVVESPSLKGWLGARMRSDHFAIDELTVPLRRLDAIDLHTAFIKIDAQGAEFEILRGLQRTIERDRPVLLIERGETFEMVQEFLRTRGFRPHLYNPALDQLQAVEPSANDSLNVFFLPGKELVGEA